MKTFHLKIVLVIVFATVAAHFAYSQPKSKKEMAEMINLNEYKISAMKENE